MNESHITFKQWFSFTEVERNSYVDSFATLNKWEEEFDRILLDMLSEQVEEGYYTKL